MKNTLVLGGASGIGLALAKIYRDAGDSCVMVDRLKCPRDWFGEDYYEYELSDQKRADNLWDKLEARYEPRSIGRVVLSTDRQQTRSSSRLNDNLWEMNYECVDRAYFHLNQALRSIAQNAEIVLISSNKIFEEDEAVSAALYRDTKAALTAAFMREAQADQQRRFVFAFPQVVFPRDSVELEQSAVELTRYAQESGERLLFLRLNADKSASIPIEEVQGCLARFAHLTQ